MKNKAYYYKKDVVKRSKMYGTTTYKLTVGLVPKTSDVWDGSKICAYTWAHKNNVTILDFDQVY